MYYLITQEQADLIGVIQYDVDKVFSPYVVFNGSKYYVDSNLVDLIGIEVIDWAGVETSKNIITINKPDFTTL